MSKKLGAVQLRLQGEILRLSGSTDGAQELVEELVHRVEGLDLILGEDTAANSSKSSSPRA